MSDPEHPTLVHRKKKKGRGSLAAAAPPAGDFEREAPPGHRRTHTAPSLEPTRAAVDGLDSGTEAPLLASHDGHAVRQDANASRSRWTVVQKSVWTGWCSLLDLMPNKVVNNQLFVPAIPARMRQRLLDFQEVALVPYDKADMSHPPLLLRLWDLLDSLHPAVSTAEASIDRGTLVTANWKRFGFQGNDPATDFRGAGVLALRNLLYVAEVCPMLTRAMLAEEYPFAIAGTNITMTLLNILRLTKGRKTCLETAQPNQCYTSLAANYRLSMGVAVGEPPTVAVATGVAKLSGEGHLGVFSGAVPCSAPASGTAAAAAAAKQDQGFLQGSGVVFSEVFCVACYCLQEHWLKSSKNIMEFNTVLKAAKLEIEHWLRDAPTISAFCARMPDIYRQ